jgi:hypothetical protein
MALFLNPYNSKRELGGKGKGRRHIIWTTPSPGKVTAWTEVFDYIHNMGRDNRPSSPCWHRNQEETTHHHHHNETVVEEENRHDHGVSMTWPTMVVIGKSL